MTQTELDSNTAKAVAGDPVPPAATPMPTESELAASWALAPDHVSAFLHGRSGPMKDSPLHFVGREGELGQLMSLLAHNFEKKPKIQKPPGRMVIAAPGAGKTSLITELENRLRKQGTAVILIQPEQMISAHAFSEAIRSNPPWNTDEGIKSVAKKLGLTVAIGTDKVVQLFASTAAAAAGKGGDVTDVEAVRTVLEMWLQGKTPAIQDVLQVLDHGRAKGCVVLVDEAQTLKDWVETEENKTCATLILRTLGVPGPRKRAGIDRATIVLAGLPDTPGVAKSLGSPGMTPEMLTPLHHSYIRRIMRRAIEIAAGSDTRLAEDADQAWGDFLTIRYGDWTRHAQAAAMAAHDMLAHYGRDLLTAEWGIGALVHAADQYRRQAYREVLEKSDEYNVDSDIRNIVAQALLRNCNRIPEKKLHTLVGRRITQNLENDFGEMSVAERSEIVPPKRTENILRLLRSGILDRTAHLHDDSKADTANSDYFCPIPSLIRHMTKCPPNELEQMLDLIAKTELSTNEPEPGGEQFQPEWVYWTEERARQAGYLPE